MNTAQDHIYGWANAWATVKVHVHGVVIRDVGVDRSRKLVIIYWETNTLEENRSTTI